MSPEEEVVPSRDSGGGELPHGLFQGIAPMPSGSEEEGLPSRDLPNQGKLRRDDGERNSREAGVRLLDPPGGVELRRGDGEWNSREC